MRDDLSHVPQKQHDELARMQEFESAIALGHQPWKRGGRTAAEAYRIAERYFSSYQSSSAAPRGTKLDPRRFELLKRAFVEARYSPNYSISIKDLDALYASVKRLRYIVTRLGEKKVAELSRLDN